MKKILLILLGNFIFFFSIAQNTQPTITVKGSVIDSTNNQSLSYVTATLQDPKTQLSVKSTLAKDDGSFELTAPAGKPYQLVLVFVGYRNKTIPVNETGTIINLNKIALSPSNKTLDAVSISAPKPLMKQEVDRLSYDVQADPETKTQNHSFSLQLVLSFILWSNGQVKSQDSKFQIKNNTSCNKISL